MKNAPLLLLSILFFYSTQLFAQNVDYVDEDSIVSEGEEAPETPESNAEKFDEYAEELPKASGSDEFYDQIKFQDGVDGKKNPRSSEYYWFRTPGEWIASRTVRDTLMAEPTALIFTDGKRYDVNAGKRLPIFHLGGSNHRNAWSLGFDAGVNATLVRKKNAQGELSFATETFDGFFGGYLGKALNNTIVMLRVAHLSAHRVDNNPEVLLAIPYSRFWIEALVGHNLIEPKIANRFSAYIQLVTGFNFKADPAKDGPRVLVGMDLGYEVFGPGGLAIIGSIDYRLVGVLNQDPHYSTFLGVGYVKKPNMNHRPLRFGISQTWGSDHRSQYFNRDSKFRAFTMQLEF